MGEAECVQSPLCSPILPSFRTNPGLWVTISAAQQRIEKDLEVEVPCAACRRASEEVKLTPVVVGGSCVASR